MAQSAARHALTASQQRDRLPLDITKITDFFAKGTQLIGGPGHGPIGGAPRAYRKPAARSSPPRHNQDHGFFRERHSADRRSGPWPNRRRATRLPQASSAIVSPST